MDPDRHLIALSKISLLAHVGKKWVNFDKFKLIYIPIVLIKSFFLGMSEGKINKKKLEGCFFSCRRQFLLVEVLIYLKIY